MLDRNKLVQLFDRVSDQLFSHLESDQLALAVQTWEMVANNEAFSTRVAESESSFLLPAWRGELAQVIETSEKITDYMVLGVDGSQVYPERHLSGVGCFVINTGGCLLRYGQKSSVEFFSEPALFLPEKLSDDFGYFSLDMVDLKREALEFERAYNRSMDALKRLPRQAGDLGRKPFVFLFDGSLIFWHLEGKPQDVRDAFLRVYLESLQKFYDKAIVMAGYISMPKSRELVNLLRIGLCRFDRANCIPCHTACKDFPCEAVDQVIDAQLCQILLPKFARTTIFHSTSKIVESYPDHLKPVFFYLNVGNEIVRIEVPLWVSQDSTAIDLVCAVALDQVAKGCGYPVALAEAHEQAVIRGADRDFFYHVVSKRSIEHQRRVFLSPKSVKKRGIGI